MLDTEDLPLDPGELERIYLAIEAEDREDTEEEFRRKVLRELQAIRRAVEGRGNA